MATYAYSAINAQGLELKGEIEASDATAAREQLRNRGLLPAGLEEVGAGTDELSGRFKKVKPKALQVFSRQFATMIEAGISVVGALVVLEEQTDDNQLAVIVGQLRADVEAGMLLSQAMAKHPKVFGRLYVAMVETGEAAGILDTVLDRVAIQIEKETAIKRRVKGAMLYPTLVLGFASIVLAGMLMFLVPVFVGIFESLDGQLPTLTRGVVGASEVLRAWWFIIFPAIGAGIFGFRRWKASEGGRRAWDAFKLRIPVFGKLVQLTALARFSRTLASLLRAGVPLLESLEITSGTVGNTVVSKAITDMQDGVKQGEPMVQRLVNHAVFPPMVVQMIAVGEETGAVDTMLDKIGEFYEQEIEATVDALTSLLEPALIVVLGGCVGGMVISLYMPMFNIIKLIK